MRSGNTRLHRSRVGLCAVALICGVFLCGTPALLLHAASSVSFNYLAAAGGRVGIAPVATAVADLNGDGKADLVVANSGNNAVSVLLGKGDGTFTNAPGSPIIVGTKPVAVKLADLNGDGKQDLVVVNQGDLTHAGTVSVLLGKGDGTFTNAPGSPITTGMSPTAVAIGDLNGDGRPDLAVVNQDDSTVSVLRGNGDGTFTAFGAAITVGMLPFDIALGDLNGDGRPDLVVANARDDTLSVLLGNGSGAFSAAAGSPITIPNAPDAVALGDLNGDGKLDIVVGTAGPRGRVYSLLGVGDGTFAAPVASPIFAFSPITSVAIAEIDGNTRPDVLASGIEGNVVYVLHGNGDGTFTYSPSTDRLFVGTNPTGVAVADFNGDGKRDFLVANTDDNTISVYFGNGVGGFTLASPAPPIPGVSYFSSVAVADFNSDSKPDLAVTYGFGQLSILLGDGHGGFTRSAASPISLGSSSLIVVIGDFNGDHKADLAAMIPGGNLYILLGNGDGTFGAPLVTSPPSGTFWNTLAAGDLTGDGKADLAVGDYVHNTITPLISAGNGTFTVGSAIAVGQNPADVEIADLNGDGKADIVVTNTNDNTVTVLLSNSSSNGTFTQASGSPISVGMAPKQVVIADLNGDGKKDLVVANFNDDTVSVLLGNGNGTFTAAPGSPIANALGNNGVLAVGDLNGDGIPDLAIPDSTADGYIDVLTGNGNGSFTANGAALGGAPDAVAYGAANRFTLADVNGDGKQDIIAVGGNISVLLNVTVSISPTPNPAPSPHPTLGSGGAIPAPQPTPHAVRTPTGGIGSAPTPIPQPVRH